MRKVNACQSGSTGMTSRIHSDSKEILYSPADEWRHLGKTSTGTWIVADSLFADFAIIFVLKDRCRYLKFYVYLPYWLKICLQMKSVNCFYPTGVQELWFYLACVAGGFVGALKHQGVFPNTRLRRSPQARFGNGNGNGLLDMNSALKWNTSYLQDGSKWNVYVSFKRDYSKVAWLFRTFPL